MAEGQCNPSATEVCRANLDIMPEGTALWMYIFTAIATLIALYGIWEMVRVWRMGRKWQRGDLMAGLKRFIGAMATHRKFQQDKKPGTMHAWIFYGFVALFITTALVAIDADFFELILGAKLLDGYRYLLLEAFADTFGVLFVLGVGYALYRRYSEKPPQLHGTQAHEAPWLRWMSADMYALLFLFTIGITGFLMEALRLQHQIQVDGITHQSWSYVGNSIGLAFQNTSPETIASLYVPLWWIHFFLWTSTMAILPWTKLRHIITSSLNLVFVDPERQARPALSAPFDLKEVMESENPDMPDVGVATIREFTWKDRLAFDACTNCGRCEAQCPAYAAGRPLSPRKLIQDLKGQMWEDYRQRNKDGYTTPKLVEVDGIGEAIDETTLWSCTTCRACVTECPVDINHVDMIVDMRRALVNESKLDEHQQNLIINITNAGNPYGFAASDRDAWTQALPAGVAVPRAPEKVAAGETFEYLWWIGCSGSFDPRNQEVTRSIAHILNAAEVDFAIMGNDEKCTGDPVRRLGEEGRFQQSVIENLMAMDALGVKKIITQCPHCFNTLRNEYPEFGADWEVVHHTQLIESLLEAGRIPLADGAEMSVTYHDSCYLGRHNDIFEAPRRVLATASGLPVLEMAQSKEQGLCCGAGGANMWYEVDEEEQRINVIRAKQAAETGASTVATACPFCLTMMKDGLSLTGAEDKGMVAMDLAEIVAKRLDWTPPEVENAEAAGGAADDGGAAPVWVG